MFDHTTIVHIHRHTEVALPDGDSAYTRAHDRLGTERHAKGYGPTPRPCGSLSSHRRSDVPTQPSRLGALHRAKLTEGKNWWQRPATARVAGNPSETSDARPKRNKRKKRRTTSMSTWATEPWLVVKRAVFKEGRALPYLDDLTAKNAPDIHAARHRKKLRDASMRPATNSCIGDNDQERDCGVTARSPFGLRRAKQLPQTVSSTPKADKSALEAHNREVANANPAGSTSLRAWKAPPHNYQSMSGGPALWSYRLDVAGVNTHASTDTRRPRIFSRRATSEDFDLCASLPRATATFDRISSSAALPLAARKATREHKATPREKVRPERRCWSNRQCWARRTCSHKMPVASAPRRRRSASVAATSTARYKALARNGTRAMRRSAHDLGSHVATWSSRATFSKAEGS